MQQPEISIHPLIGRLLNKKIYEKEIYAISYFCFKLYENFFHKRLTCCIIKIDWNKSEI